MISVITNTGSVEHLSQDGKITLCGTLVHGEGTMPRKCKRCTAKAEKLAADRDRREYATRAVETQDEVMSQADHREPYEVYARWAVGPVMTREQYEAKGVKIAADRAAGTLSTNPYEWGKDKVVISPVEPEHMMHYGNASVLCGRMPVFVGAAFCEGGDGPCPSACNCGCASGEFECMCENVTSNMVKVTCQDCRTGLHRAVDAPETPSEPRWLLVDSKTGEMIKPGTEREDSLGETWRVSKITRTPEIGKSGKVLATDSRGWTQELYPSVFGLVITDSEITPGMVGCWLEGTHGWQNNHRVVDRASEFGFRVPGEYIQALAEYRVNGDTCDEDVWENIAARGGLAELATDFLNNRAPEGYSFVWDMGELSLMSDAELI